MTQEDKELLLKDLCARTIYRPFVQLKYGAYNKSRTRWLTNADLSDRVYIKPEIRWLTGVDWPDRIYINSNSDYYNIEDIKPYLRPMSSMTEEEKKELNTYSSEAYWDSGQKKVDWLNAHNFDYRGLIEKGLAIEAPEGMYN